MRLRRRGGCAAYSTGVRGIVRRSCGARCGTPRVTDRPLQFDLVAEPVHRVHDGFAGTRSLEFLAQVLDVAVDGACVSRVSIAPHFTEQRLAPGEKREMAVVFYVDPELVKDSDQNDLNTITLSYTFYPVRDKAGVADSAPAAVAGRRS